LMDSQIGTSMVDWLNLQGTDTVIEIGPGLGALTEILVNRLPGPPAKIYAVEIDPRFVAKLNTMFLDDLHVAIVQENVLSWLPQFVIEADFKVLGSLPYYITSPILHALVKMQKKPSCCVLLIQKEVAKKICAVSPDSSYLSTFIQTFFRVEYLATVPKEKFEPAPKVDGGIIRLTRNDLEMSLEDMGKYEAFLHRGFSKPRKMLNKVFTGEELAQVGLDKSLRPQNVTVDQWLGMFRAQKEPVHSAL